MARDTDEEETTSTTFTYKNKTEKFLKLAYPDAIGMSEAIRNAIADARKVNEEADDDSRSQEDE